MSESSSESDLDFLTECPQCGQQFNETSRTPRYLSCCSETICQPCLSCSQNNGRLVCPICHKQHNKHKSVADVPVDPLVMKLLPQLKLCNTALPCGYCFSKKDAVAICRQCVDVLCQACLSTHSRSTLPIDHKVVPFEEIKLSRISPHGQFTRSLSVQSMSLLGQLKEKAESLKSRIEELESVYRNITLSKKKASDDICATFDELVKELQSRKELLLSQVGARADDNAFLVTRAKVSHQTLYGKIKKQANNISRGRKGIPSVTMALLQATPVDVEFARKGVSFVPSNVMHVSSIITSAGLVRTVTFSPTPKPEGVPNSATYNAVTMDPTYIPLVSTEDVGFLTHNMAQSEQTCSLGDQVVVLKTDSGTKTLFCPSLEWDTSTASKTLTTSRSVITNAKPEVPLPRTGCRIQAERHVMTTKPLLMRNGQRALYQIKLNLVLKMAIQANKMLFEASLTDSPVDSSWNKPAGLSVNVASCSNHTQQLCLHVVHDNTLLEDTPIAQNKAGVSRGLHLGFLLNSARNEIHVVDIEDVRVVCSVTDTDFDKPLWVMMMLSHPAWSNMAAAVVSGTRVHVSKDINRLLSSLQ